MNPPIFAFAKIECVAIRKSKTYALANATLGSESLERAQHLKDISPRMFAAQTQGSPTARKYSQLSSPATLGLTFSLFPSGASNKTILNCFILAYPGGAPKNPSPKTWIFYPSRRLGISSGVSRYIISPNGAVSHHAPACIFPAAWWYTTLRVDDMQFLAELMIYKAHALISLSCHFDLQTQEPLEIGVLVFVHRDSNPETHWLIRCWFRYILLTMYCFWGILEQKEYKNIWSVR